MPISIPKFFQKAFAQNGGRQDVPVTGDTSGGRASYDVGFPPVTRTPIIAGGIPPFGTDFNGVLYDLSQSIQYLQSGVTFPFDQDFADAIGGYSVKAIVADPSDPTILWQNNNANNTLPPSAPNGWTQVFSAAELNQNPTESQRGAPFLASNADADAGVENTKMMSAAKVLRLIRAAASNATETLRGTLRIGTQAEVNGGLLDDVSVTPKKLHFGFSALFSQNGYVAFPSWLGGFVIQWGRFTGASAFDTDYTITFPLSFPNSCWGAQLTNENSAKNTTSDGALCVVSLGLGSFVMRTMNNATGQTQPSAVYWFAVGN